MMRFNCARKKYTAALIHQLVWLLLVSLLSSACRPALPSPKTVKGDRPNFVIIMSDDQRYDTMEYMPRTKRLIFDAGVTFSKGYVTTPLCCPSRSSIFTGMYAHAHGVHTNTDSLTQTTVIERLHQSGYYTGLVGKYLNSWDGARREEFDYWAVFAGHGAASIYTGPRINLNGVWEAHNGYITYILRDYVVEMARQASQQDKPFALFFTPNAPHDPADPAPGDEALYPNLALYRPPSFNEQDLSGKPDWLQNSPPLKGIKRLDAFRLKQLQSLNALDQAVESFLNVLSEAGKLDNTLVIYLSDNGVFWGEHQLQGKTYVYEEAIHVPFAARYPPLQSQPRVENHLVANIDIAPTLYELAGLAIPPNVDGRSLVPLLKGDGNWRDVLLIEGWPETTPGGEQDGDQSEASLPYAAIHTGRYVYIETVGDRTELYDLKDDPYQLFNQVNNPAYADIVANLQKQLSQARTH
jgi:arylsulfatase A-like enzyme